VYKPNPIYFEKLLDSVEIQTYSNIEINIIDDSECLEAYNYVKKTIKKHLANSMYYLSRNEKNLGSNKTFEKLVEMASGDYIAFCDQDDIWEPSKISKLIDKIEEEKSILCYSDLSVIDSNDNQIATSFTKLNKRINHLHGDDLFKYLLRRNFVTGCTMLIRSDVAKEAIPFCHDFYVHDHWLSLFAASKGSITYVAEPLIKYRIHGNNQIGSTVLNGIESKSDYIVNKLNREIDKYNCLLEEYEFNENHRKDIYEILKWTKERLDFFKEKNFKNLIKVLKKIKIDYQLIILELFINLSSKKLSKYALKKIKS
jgi:glycosyltransferase involved in cell wall biosynthesis